ncbi:MAG: hypothetical protein IPJ65_00500 [Archangiaceae bacterium]|nr:hypothetical protein [Archangiaceae bacterium]
MSVSTPVSRPSFTERSELGLRVSRLRDMLVLPRSAVVAISRFGTEGSRSPPSATMVAFMSVMPCSETSPSDGLGPSGMPPPTAALMGRRRPAPARAARGVAPAHARQRRLRRFVRGQPVANAHRRHVLERERRQGAEGRRVDHQAVAQVLPLPAEQPNVPAP